MSGTRDPIWFATLRPGDVLRSRHGTLRVVREVTRKPNGALRSVVLVIRRRSWTNRCHTTYFASDLKTFGFRFAGARVSLRSAFDRQIARAIRLDDPRLTPDDVRGVA